MDPLVRNLLACALLTAGVLVLLGYTIAFHVAGSAPVWLLWIGVVVASTGICLWLPTLLAGKSTRQSSTPSS